ncbi:MAG: AMP-binding protein [Sphingobium sp.]
MDLFLLLEASARRYARNSAILRGGECFSSWEDVHHRALSLASALSGTGARGDRIAIISKNCAEYVEILFAAWAAGRIVVPVNAKLHAREAVDIIEASGATIIFADAAQTKALGEILPEGGPRIITIGSDAYHEMLARPAIAPHRAAPDDIAWLFYTSGTTGKPKGAKLSHRNLLAMTLAHLADFESVEADDALVHAAPMSHGSGLLILPYVARGGRQIIPASGGFDPAEFLDLCAAHGRCGAFLAPTMVQRLRRHVEEQGATTVGLRHIIYGGGPMYLDEIQRSLATFGPIFSQLFGQGEAPMTITGLRRNDFTGADEATLASVGWARSGVEIAVVDEQFSPLPSGEVGEIVCRGDIVMRGYWRDDAATAATIRDGWLMTGDMGSLDETGQLTLRDRSKDVIISGGTNIYPREVEEALLSHPDVAEISVVGMTDEEWGEIVVAFVVAIKGARPSSDLLDRHCLDRIARFKRPKYYHFLEELPKNSYGKVLKRDLKLLLTPQHA